MGQDAIPISIGTSFAGTRGVWDCGQVIQEGAMMEGAVSQWTGTQSCPKSNAITSSNMHALSWERRERA